MKKDKSRFVLNVVLLTLDISVFYNTCFSVPKLFSFHPEKEKTNKYRVKLPCFDFILIRSIHAKCSVTSTSCSKFSKYTQLITFNRFHN